MHVMRRYKTLIKVLRWFGITLLQQRGGHNSLKGYHYLRVPFFHRCFIAALLRGACITIPCGEVTMHIYTTHGLAQSHHFLCP